ncbi:UNKNOWN [Stylonychia lemnae]|uniref:Uncharacterized protein n=1 Tax=Stylonychia lemnae TaxID=5949 RepID=A0A078ARN2_STYLE|nr:UNKNOWN [Stylonychia lemnae]|eukprot:CDW83508.1 UNKNOWN [Stylonychia lemnae]
MYIASKSIVAGGNNAQMAFCGNNYDCIQASFCCSTYSCVHPSVCLHGQKLHNDNCDYNFECLSRCCNDNKCSHFLRCYDKCLTNADCKMTGCCSEQYCTQDIVCAGNKAAGDSCDEDRECLSDFCFNNSCTQEKYLFPIWIWVILGITFLTSIILMLLIVYHKKMCCFRQKVDISLALNNIADMKSKREPLLAPISDIGHDIIVQNTSRKFLYKNPKKLIPNVAIDQKFKATPIQEVFSENKYHTYDPQSKSVYHDESLSNIFNSFCDDQQNNLKKWDDVSKYSVKDQFNPEMRFKSMSGSRKLNQEESSGTVDLQMTKRMIQDEKYHRDLMVEHKKVNNMKTKDNSNDLNSSDEEDQNEEDTLNKNEKDSAVDLNDKIYNKDCGQNRMPPTKAYFQEDKYHIQQFNKQVLEYCEIQPLNKNKSKSIFIHNDENDNQKQGELSDEEGYHESSESDGKAQRKKNS